MSAIPENHWAKCDKCGEPMQGILAEYRGMEAPRKTCTPCGGFSIHAVTPPKKDKA